VTRQLPSIARTWIRYRKAPPYSTSVRKLNVITAVVTDDNKALLERGAQMLTKLIESRRPTE
jgi:hypothetical protein